MSNITPFIIGHHDSRRDNCFHGDLATRIQDAGYDMITYPITTPRFHNGVLSEITSYFSSNQDRSLTSSHNAVPVVLGSLSPEDSDLTPDSSISSLIATTSSWIDLTSAHPVIVEVSRQVLRLELQYAAFCGISHVIIRGPRSGDVQAYAHAILEGLNAGPYMQISLWFDVDGISKKIEDGDLAGLTESRDIPANAFQAWRNWDTIRSVCKYSTRLQIALNWSRDASPEILSRWYSEPVRIVTLHANVFRQNNKGFHTLSTEAQKYILRLMRLKTPPWLLLCDTLPLKLGSQPGDVATGDFPALGQATRDWFLDYLRHLQTKRTADSPMDLFGSGYQDYLQAPLQPLTVNLESVTYEVFEKDPIKYEWYEKAIARALNDWVEQGKPTSNPDGRVVVAVVGAGRGPLVSRALKAAEDTGVDIDMWALEKNQNAYVLLQRHNKEKWSGKVNLVKSDMRTWHGPSAMRDLSKVKKEYNLDPDEEHEEVVQDCDGPLTEYPIDIIVSELLGSFADNELSPECLDGVQHLLNPVHGISVPASYTAHFTPIAAPKLHADISLHMTSTNAHAAEIPYVVMLDQIDFLSIQGSLETKTAPQIPSRATTPEIHTAWSFHHPNSHLPQGHQLAGKPSNAHNSRYHKSTFPIRNEGTCHGLAGYFETVLYQGVELSTNPLTMEKKSDGMISWFPIFFPFKIPIHFPEGSEVEVSMWRVTDDRRVWYEWMAEVLIEVGGKRLKTAMTDLHSSEKEACLM